MQKSQRETAGVKLHDYFAPSICSFFIKTEKGFALSTFGYGSEGVAGEDPGMEEWGDLAML